MLKLKSRNVQEVGRNRNIQEDQIVSKKRKKKEKFKKTLDRRRVGTNLKEFLWM